MGRQVLGLLVVMACGTASTGGSPPTKEPERGLVEAAIRLGPSCAAPPGSCDEIRWSTNPISGRKHSLAVVGSSILWSDETAIGIDSVCPGTTSHILPGSADTSILTVATNGSVSIAVGVHTIVVDGRYKSDVVPWIDHGAGFVKVPPWSDQVVTNTRARAAVNAAGRIGIAWLDGSDNSDLMFTLLDDDGTPHSNKLGSLGKSFSYRDVGLVAVPSGGWMFLVSGSTLREDSFRAILIDANGSSNTSSDTLGVEIFKERYGRFAATWDGSAVAIASEWGDYGRPAYSPTSSCRDCGIMGSKGIADNHEIRFVRIDEHAKPLGPPISFKRDDDVINPAGLLFVNGSYWLAGAEGFSAYAPSSARNTPQLLRFDPRGHITQRLSLGTVAPPYLALTLDQGMIRGAMTEADGVRAFAVGCAK